jgi:uncharacterized RDD family membrane protein YckC
MEYVRERDVQPSSSTAGENMSADYEYIERVIDQLPREATLRAQVAMELRSHIAERLEHGNSVEEALQQLGDPVVLAESYLAAIPLIPASFGRRAVARILDALGVVAVCAPIVWLIAIKTEFFFVILTIGVLLSVAALYPLLAEYFFGTTIGKRAMGLRVVRESGARITFGQSVVRQLPVFLEVFWIDVLFALFTEKHQRAFEILSKTRVVTAMENES